MYREFIKSNYKVLLDIMNALKVGVYITDGKGDTILVNDESCKTGGLTRNEIVGKNMKYLEDMGFVEQSLTLQTIENGKDLTMIQNLGDGNKVFVSSAHLCDGNGADDIDIIICTERDITETLSLKETLKEKEEIAKKTKEELEYLKQQNITMWGNIIAEDDETKQLANFASRVAKVDSTILLTGDSGTGKEVFANFIYENSQRVRKPFIKVNCAAIPENLLESEWFGYEGGAFTGADKNGKIGFFEMANHGTLFLDEIGEIPMHLQPKLLRVLQEREIVKVGGTELIPVDFRLIAATNKDLTKAVEEGTFRKDLYYRLNIMPVHLNPLRGRNKDIQAFTYYFIENFNKNYKLKKVISQDAIKSLQEYSWPGNIRELENIIERIMISFDGDVITKFQVEKILGILISDNNIESDPNKTLKELLEEYEKHILQLKLGENKRPSEISKELGVNKSTLSRRMEKYDLKLK